MEKCTQIWRAIFVHSEIADRQNNKWFRVLSHVESSDEKDSKQRFENGIPSWAPNWTSTGLRYPYFRLREVMEPLFKREPNHPESRNISPSHVWAGSRIFGTCRISGGKVLAISSVIEEVSIPHDAANTLAQALSAMSQKWRSELECMCKPVHPNFFYYIGDKNLSSLIDYFMRLYRTKSTNTLLPIGRSGLLPHLCYHMGLQRSLHSVRCSPTKTGQGEE